LVHVLEANTDDAWPDLHSILRGVAWSCVFTGCAGAKTDSGLACPSWSQPQAVAIIDNTTINEASGLATSSTHGGLLWTHNDDGDEDGVLHAVAVDGTVSGSLTLGGASPVDWESVAASGGNLFVGDVGDNNAEREEITIFRTPEPAVVEPGGEAGVVERFRFTWPGGPRDAEAMLIDPTDGRLLVLSRDSDRVEVMRLPALDGASDGEAGSLVRTIDLNSGPYAGLGAVRGADAAADGSVVLRLSDGVVWLPGAGSAVDALAGFGCRVPNPPETDGEGVAVSDDTLYFVGEGEAPTLWAITREDA
jgi:hypothetical protein